MRVYGILAIACIADRESLHIAKRPLLIFAMSRAAKIAIISAVNIVVYSGRKDNLKTIVFVVTLYDVYEVDFEPSVYRNVWLLNFSCKFRKCVRYISSVVGVLLNSLSNVLIVLFFRVQQGDFCFCVLIGRSGTGQSCVCFSSLCMADGIFCIFFDLFAYFISLGSGVSELNSSDFDILLS